MSYLQIDLGCGGCKKPETIGIDIFPQPGVDYIVNFETELLPLANNSVDYVYSSHCLEHLKDPTKIFAEISRVCIDGAKLELWTPYAWENSAFIIDHKLFFNEDHYLHICVWFVDFWRKILNATWILTEFTFIIEPQILVELYENKISLDFALKYYKGIVKEFCANIEVRKDYQGEIVQPQRTFSVSRSAPRHLIPSQMNTSFSDTQLEAAIDYFSNRQ
ncbi:class I SAM-dependent methyltransferase [Nodularia harveyana UHCC-0300]|uniref:Class I SAM-dependent methyltransferase n=1 Tax=Nodularia harveyana UHCC-0300 TaxID=2974287 RepID=A0ABU5UIM8_9CYAN|nr:class I SAM-dependent methyltransferase [Nodularia harveyana]MEA5582846.1 class I SAM-dependent methyltransferase [Nodularia harveyana UHCC-0300]